ncbi:MAG: hypothetical protein E7178_02560 [Erysipelotrichaceae bacterium]|jgi:hypothetical protein|nr:hypothetical protein [Erysipelotrichaceae bacterium]
MAISDLTARFTDEKYASKSEVMKELGTSLVDNIWSNILAYRRSKYIKTTLKCLDSSDLVLYKGTGIENLVSSFEEKLSHYISECELFSDDERLFEQFKINCNANVISYLSSFHKQEKSEALSRGLVQGTLKPNNDIDMFLLRYKNALDNLNNDDINEEFILRLHNLVSGRNDGYRRNDDNSLTNRVLIDRLYSSAKASYIPLFINQLINFINNSELPFVYKGIIACYYLNLIKPFSDYNEEVSLLLLKAILMNEGVGPLIKIVPLEKVLNRPSDELSKMLNDSQRYSDVTYFLYHSIHSFSLACEEISDYLALFKGSVMREESYQEDEVLQDDLLHEEKVETIELVPEEKVVETPKVEEVKPVEPVVKKEKKVKPVNEELQPTFTGIAINVVTPELDENEAKKLEKQLLETDPLLRKGEAKFYARHCVLGRNYTIQQFKKTNNCAYETARTGMDHLVELGYYRKGAIKNKFIYTPIPRR